MTTLLYNKKILITAGPTREAIDPVRYISNHSSGKMGYAIARQFLQQGADVVLISGPVCLELEHPRLTLVKVSSAIEMSYACSKFFPLIDIAVFSAAVADYRPEKIADRKIKKSDSAFTLRMVKNPDIAADFGKTKYSHQLSIGFALETNDEYSNALDKLHRKNFDMVILNSMNDAEATFGYDTNKITVIKNDLTRKEFLLKDKNEVAKDIINEIASLVIQKEFKSVSLI